jgi:hypothetical protein
MTSPVDDAGPTGPSNKTLGKWRKRSSTKGPGAYPAVFRADAQGCSIV